ncbi:MAG: SHOCT domain-containing protein [Candidatus Methylomirabilis sp.]
MLLGMGVFVLFWVLVLAGLALLIRWLWVQARPTARAEESALDILKRRYARGEITREEFETIRRDLLA